MKTLLVTKYNGHNIYVRHLFKETFEYLIPLRGQIFSNIVEFNKERRRKNQPYTKDEEVHIMDTMRSIAQTFLDEDKIKRSPAYKLNSFIHGLKDSERKSSEAEAPR